MNEGHTFQLRGRANRVMLQKCTVDHLFHYRIVSQRFNGWRSALWRPAEIRTAMKL